MRRSSLKHPLAVLRKIIGYDQDMMAHLIRCSPSAVKSIEVGRLKMSPRLAQATQNRTGVSAGWLLAGDAKAPPVSAWGDPYDVGVFKDTEAGLNLLNPQIEQAVKNSSARGAEVAILELATIYKETARHPDRNVIFSEIGQFISGLITKYELEQSVWENGSGKLKVGEKFREGLSALLNKEFGSKAFATPRLSKEKERRLQALANEDS